MLKSSSSNKASTNKKISLISKTFINEKNGIADTKINKSHEQKIVIKVFFFKNITF